MAQFGFGGGLARRRAALHAIRALSAVIPTPCQSLPGIGRRGRRFVGGCAANGICQAARRRRSLQCIELVCGSELQAIWTLSTYPYFGSSDGLLWADKVASALCQYDLDIQFEAIWLHGPNPRYLFPCI